MDVHETLWIETETRVTRLETRVTRPRPQTHVSEIETRPRRSKFCPRRDRGKTETRRRSFRDVSRDVKF